MSEMEEPVSTTSQGVGRATAVPDLHDRAGLGKDSQVLDLLTEWIERYHRSGGELSMGAIDAAGEAARDALRSGYSLEEAFQAGRHMYFLTLST